MNSFDEFMSVNKAKYKIYMDNQASTQIDMLVLQKMLPFMTEHFGNPHSSEHFLGWVANDAVKAAQSQVANFINAFDSEIVFTSGATEANNLAMIGLSLSALNKIKKRTILISSIEHKSILGCVKYLTSLGFNIQEIPVDSSGLVDVDLMRSLLNEDVFLISVMATNNEIGTNQPLKEIGELCAMNNILFHVDGAQGAYLNLDVIDLNIDFLSLSAHKMYGPKGIGCLFINQNAYLKPSPIIHGGSQQDGYRSGTLATFLVVGMGESCALMSDLRSFESKQLEYLRNKLWNKLQHAISEIRMNGSILDQRHPGNLNVLFPKEIDVRHLIYTLQPYIAISTGSACITGIEEPSYVLKNIGLSTQEAENSCRISLGRFNKEIDIDIFMDYIISYMKK